MVRQEGISERITEFCNRLWDLHNASTAGSPISDYFGPFEAEYGSKYCRVVQNAHGSKSVYCFVDLSNGDIYKAASWKIPAKGKRASIWNEDCDVGTNKPCNVFGGGLYKR